MVDYSSIPTDDLIALKSGDLKKVSTQTLQILSGKPTEDLRGKPPVFSQSVDEQTGVPDWGRKDPNAYAWSELTKGLKDFSLIGGDPDAPTNFTLEDRQRMAPYIRMGLEGGGAALGAVVGAGPAIATGPFAPAVEAAATGGGYMVGKQLANRYDEWVGLKDKTTAAGAAKEVASSAPEAAMVGLSGPLGSKAMDVVGSKLFAGEEAAKNVIRNAWDKAIRPKVTGKGSFNRKEDYYKNVEGAINSHIETAKLENGGKLPESLPETEEIISKTKARLFKEQRAVVPGGFKYDPNKQRPIQLDESGKEVANQSVLDQLNSLANSERLMTTSTAAVNEVKDVIAKLGPKVRDGEVIENMISYHNHLGQKFFQTKDPNDAVPSAVHARIAKILKDDMADQIGTKGGEEWLDFRKRYGEQLAIEKEVSHRATVDARKAARGFFSPLDAVSNAEFLFGLASMNPAHIVASLGVKGTKKAIERANDPNRVIRNMYRAVDKIRAEGEAAKTPVTHEQDEAFRWINGKFKTPEDMAYEEPTLLPPPSPKLLPEPRGPQIDLPEKIPPLPTPKLLPRYGSTPTIRLGETTDSAINEAYANRQQLDAMYGQVTGFPPNRRLLTQERMPMPEKTFSTLESDRLSKIGSPLKRDSVEVYKARETPAISSDVQKVIREEPALSKLIKETPKFPNGRAITQEVMVVTNKLNQFRAAKGLPPIGKSQIKEIDAYMQHKALEKINAFRVSKGLDPLVVKSSIE